MQSKYFKFGLFALFFLTTSIAFAAAGRIQFVTGDVKIQNSQKVERQPKKGENIDSGDTLVTGSNGSMQVLLADGGLLAVRPNTQLRIDDYAYSGKADDKDNKSFFSLAKGTFRSITGAIGKNNKDAYKVTTPTATMGIRGTDHEPAYFPPFPPGFPIPPGAPPPGTYDRVNSGQTFILTPYGFVVINPNQVGFAPFGGGRPSILPYVPGFYVNAIPGLTRIFTSDSGGGDGGGGSQGDSTGSNFFNTFFNDGTFFTGNPFVSTNTTITTNPAISSVIATTTTAPPIAPLGTVLLSTYADGQYGPLLISPVVVVTAPPTQQINLGTQYEVLSFYDGTVPILATSFSSNTSSLTNQGAVTTSDGARIDWGRWTPGYTVTPYGSPGFPVGDFQYIFSTNITPASFPTSGALTGAITYNYVGGTAPTDSFGNAATLNSATLSVNFTSQVVNMSVNVSTSGGGTLSGAGVGSIPMGSSAFSISPASGDALVAYGQLVGPTAGGAITSYQISNGMVSAIGTAAFKR